MILELEYFFLCSEKKKRQQAFSSMSVYQNIRESYSSRGGVLFSELPVSISVENQGHQLLSRGSAN